MAVLTRVTTFIPNTLIQSSQVNSEFNQLVNILSGVSTDKDALLKYSHAADPVLRVDQLGAGLIQQWLQNGAAKANITNAGALTSVGVASTGQIATSFNHASNPALDVNQIGAGLIQRWQNNGADRATLSALGKLLLPAGIGATPSTDQISNFGTYFTDVAARATGANTTETDFSSKTMAANTFGADGDFIIVIGKAVTAANANTKRWRLYFNGTVTMDTGAIALNNGGLFFIAYISRVTSTGFDSASLWVSSTFLAGGFGNLNVGQAAGQNFAASNILKTTGQNGTASANDLIQQNFIVLKGSV